MPAETLRRLGVDLPAFRDELAGLAGVPGSRAASISLDPRAKRVIERAEDEAARLGDEYVSTEHLLLGVAEAGGEAQALLERTAPAREADPAARCQRSAAASASPARTPRASTRRSRSTAAT